jgi:DNA polymerase-3 subunit delta'
MSDPGDLRCRTYAWHADAWERLCRNVQGGQQHHALLVEGAPGTGRRAFADAVAALLLCSDPTDGGNCGRCRACQLRAAGSHGDLLQVEPEEAGKAIGIDAIRSAIAFANGTSTLGERKVLLIAPAQDLTIAAFNAFLKCLEEPAPGTFVLLVSARGHLLPPTIRSRCQRVLLPQPSDEETLAWLRQILSEEGAIAADEQLEALLRLAPRRPLAALRLYGAPDGEATLALDAMLHGSAAAHDQRVGIEQAARQLAPEQLIDVLENAVCHRLRSLPVTRLRSPAGTEALAGLRRLETLRAAQRAGQNPNAELLRREAISAFFAGQDS